METSSLGEEGDSRESQEKLAQDAKREVEEKAKAKLELRTANLAAQGRPVNEALVRKKDANIKKNSSFVKKLRSLTEQQRDSLSADFEGLNLTRYIQEAATAVAEAKMKVTDVGCAVHVCSLIVQRYSEFSGLLLEALQKQFGGGISKGEEKATVVSRYRLGLRLVAELVVSGVVHDQQAGLTLLSGMLTDIFAADKESGHSYVTVLLSFCRHCAEDVAGIFPRKQRELFDKFSIIPELQELIPTAKKQEYQRILHEYFASLRKHLVREHKALQRREKDNRHILQTKGEINEERRAENEQAQKSYEKLLANMGTLADLLDEEMPDLPELQPDAADGCGAVMVDVQFPVGMSESELDPFGLWEDEEIRQFYQNVTEIKTLVPAILYGGKPPSQTESSDAKDQSAEEQGEGGGGEEEKEEEQGQAEGEEAAKEGDGADVVGEELEVIDLEDEEYVPPTEEEVEETSGEASSSSPGYDDFATRLPNCMSKQMVDELATEFCMKLNSKGNRNKLVRTLFTVKKDRTDLLPFYSRLVGTLHPLLPDIAPELVTLLVRDLKYHVRKKDTTKPILIKLKTVRFLAELTKFGLCSKAEAMRCLTVLIQDFSPHSIDMACSMLEHCGRFLYRSPDSQPRTRVLLDMLVRKKQALHLPAQYISMIDNAVYYSNPPAVTQVVRVERSAVHAFMMKLLYKDLNKLNTEKVLKTVRKFSWNDPQVFTQLVDTFASIWNVKYSHIQCVANVLAGLAPLQEEAVVRVVDCILEDIRLGMELNWPKLGQRRISTVKFLGELYIYQLVESNVVFHTLYSFLSFGWNPDGTATELDPPHSYFRVRLVCALLDSCGQYFDHGTNKKRLDNFLIFFQCYLFKKRQPVPLEVYNAVTDLVGSLRPKMTLYNTAQEAYEAACELERQFKTKLGPGSQPSVEDMEVVEEDEDDIEEQRVREDADEDTQEEDECGSEEEREVGDDDDDTSFSEQEEEEEDEVAGVSGPKHIPCKEDDDLLSAFDKMMADSAQSRRNDGVRVPVMDAAVPVRSKSSKTEEAEGPGLSSFTILTRKGHKQQLKEIIIPTDSRIAQSMKDTQQAMQDERKEMKKIVLDIEQRQEEEEYQALMGAAGVQIQGQKAVKLENSGPGRRGGWRGGGGTRGGGGYRRAGKERYHVPQF